MSRSPSQPARIVISGYGVRGRQWHRHAQARRDCAVVGIADPDARAREEATRGSVRAWPALDEALETAEADAVIVASPPEAHAEQASEALGAGLGVLVEKPLALSLEAGAEVIRAAEAASRPALVGHNFRLRPQELAVRRVLAGGQLGTIRHLAVLSARPAATVPAHIGAFKHAAFTDIGTHHLDLLRTRVGRVPDEIRAQLTTDDAGATYLLTLTWSHGPTAIYSRREGGPVFHHQEWLEGDNAGLSVCGGRVMLVSPTSRPRRVRVPRRDRAEEQLLDALIGPPSSEAARTMSARESLGTVGMVEAALKSLDIGAPVEPAALAAARELAL